MSYVIGFDKKDNILRGQMGEPLPAGSVLELLKQCIAHISHTEAELYMLSSHYYHTCGINWQTDDFHELSEDHDGCLEVLNFVSEGKTLLDLIKAAREEAGLNTVLLGGQDE